ncbi:MAG: hypothetical protein R6W75_01300 [Smithellaceae bacterium]
MMGLSVKICLAGLLLLLCASGPVFGQTAKERDEKDAILTAAENAFKFMRQKNYAAIWDSLSASSRKTIIGDVMSASKKAGVTYTAEALYGDFETGGPNAAAYWNSVLTHFDPDMALEESKWAMGEISAREAQIVVLYRKSEKPAVLKMFKENGAWKFGLKESFGARSISPF